MGVVGDALNPVMDTMRRSGRIEWVGIRHEEAGAFAASAQAQLGGAIGLCMGTVGPGGIHLLNGRYDAKKSHAPVLATCGQVPSPEIGTDMFQEVDNDVLYADVSVFARTVTAAERFPFLLERAVNSALGERGVSVLTLPGDVGDLELPRAPTNRGSSCRSPGPSPPRSSWTGLPPSSTPPRRSRCSSGTGHEAVGRRCSPSPPGSTLRWC